MEWTLQHNILCNYYKYVLSNYGLGLRLGHINKLASFSEIYVINLNRLNFKV
jgi:hypothetical protein